MGGAADPVFWLHTVLKCQRNSRIIETPVLLPFQLQNKHLGKEYQC